MKTLLLFLLASTPALAVQQTDEFLSCGNNNHSIRVFRYHSGGLDTYGQLSNGVGSNVNLICNDTRRRMQEGQPVRCVGLDSKGQLVDETLTGDKHGTYTWRGIECNEGWPDSEDPI